MFSPDVRFEGFTSADWTRVLLLFQPRRPAARERDPSRPHGGVVAVHTGGRLRKLVHTDVGRLRLDDAQRDWPMSAEAVAARHDASWAAVIETGALEDIMDRFGARARRSDDLTTQLLTILQLAREELVLGRLDFWPRRLQGVPIPTPGVVRGTLDSVCPVGRTMVLGLFESGELWTSVALRRGAGGFDLIVGPDEVRGDMGLLAGDFRRDYRHLSRAIEERSGPVAFGCYAEVSTLHKLVVDPNPGAWTRAVAVRDVILSPVPAAIALPLGIDAGRAALTALRTVAERVDPMGMVVPTLRILLEASSKERDVARLLDFHPLELLRRLLSRER